jgi:hypothetical protein
MNDQKNKSIYLYCLARSDLLRFIEGKGVDGKNPILLNNFRDIVSVISMVSLSEFCGLSAESKMKDLSWIAPRACRHEKIVEKALLYSPVLPLRFGTIFSSVENIRKCLEENYYTIMNFLNKMTDKEEWAVKVMVDRTKTLDVLINSILEKDEKEIASLSPGMRYFNKQRIRNKAQKELTYWVSDICKSVMNDLICQSSDFSERKPLLLDAKGSDMEMLCNWAFLVQRNTVKDFKARIKHANRDHIQQGLFFKLSGPWPPYSFCVSLLMEETE